MEEKITGYIDHIIFRNEENGYTVLVMTTKEEEITCVGNLQAISQEKRWRLRDVMWNIRRMESSF